MGIAEAKKYIADLHKRQKNPHLWPDYLTGLPDKASILRKLEEVSPRLGRHSIAYVRISNIQPYLIKYGPDRHADIIQWAAAILKTSADSLGKGFAGTLGTHDFMVMCECRDMQQFAERTSALFRKRAVDYYSAADLKKKSTLSFRKNDGKAVRMGLMKLVYVIADRKLPVKGSDLILNMAKACDALEGSDDDMVFMTKEMLCTD
jgi:GGDEF domain-containing protein